MKTSTLAAISTRPLNERQAEELSDAIQTLENVRNELSPSYAPPPVEPVKLSLLEHVIILLIIGGIFWAATSEPTRNNTVPETKSTAQNQRR